MRIDVVKMLFIGPSSIRDAFFEKVQETSAVEFQAQRTVLEEQSPEVKTFMDALQILRGMTPVDELSPDSQGTSANMMAQQVVEQKNRIEHLKEELRTLEKEIARVRIFGNFSNETLREFEQESGRKLQFFFKKSSSHTDATALPEVIYVGSASEIDYYVSINKEKVHYEGLIEMHVDKPLGELTARQADLRRFLDEAESNLLLMAHSKQVIKQGLYDALNSYHLQSAKNKVDPHLEGGLFSAQGWVPKNKIHLIEKVAEDNHVYMSQVAIEKTDRIPTYLENSNVGLLGEDLVRVYDTPSHQDKDPSLWVFLSFGLFFSMIISDAGYGVLLILIASFLLYKFGKKGGLLKRLLKLTLFLGVGCIVWGVLTSNYLGLDFPPEHALRKISFVDWMVRKKADYVIATQGDTYKELIRDYPAAAGATTGKELLDLGAKMEDGHPVYGVYRQLADNIMMELVIFIGVVHLSLSFLRNLRRNWSGVGWVLFMIGAYLYFPSILNATSMFYFLLGLPPVLAAKIGLYVMCGGMILAWGLAILQKRLGGLVEIMHIIQVFADVVSYLRIYALALAGVIMAETFDKMGMSVPLYFGIFILIAGHTVNFILALMGGLIHGLRLNFIEWYHYSFEGGGKNFNPLALLKIE